MSKINNPTKVITGMAAEVNQRRRTEVQRFAHYPQVRHGNRGEGKGGYPGGLRGGRKQA